MLALGQSTIDPGLVRLAGFDEPIIERPCPLLDPPSKHIVIEPDRALRLIRTDVKMITLAYDDPSVNTALSAATRGQFP